MHEALNVVWLGPKPDWFGFEEAAAELETVELDCRPGAGKPRDLARSVSNPAVIHIADPAWKDVHGLRAALPESAVVLDLSANGQRPDARMAGRQAADSDLVLLGSLAELREFRRRYPSLSSRTALLRRPIDLTRYAPREALRERRDRDLRRFQRFHRLAGPMILFVGPYTEAGGLDRLIDVVYGLRERSPELRLAAIRDGALDQRYLDRCERLALGLGHHGIIEWTPDPDEVPLWCALAHVVCLPCRESVGAEAAKLAAAAGRPFVGTEVEPLLEHVAEGETGFLIPSGDIELLGAALEALLGDEEEAGRLGETARRHTEEEFSPAAAASRLQQLWAHTVDGRNTWVARGNGQA
jgi:glycosyltransferase involved in cell wall biosynthesis